jgi:hypothetical protein
MKTLILAAIRCSLMFTAVTAPIFCVRPAQAYTITLEQMGPNVVATGSGAINLTGLSFVTSQVGQGGNGVIPNLGVIIIGPGTSGLGVDLYTGFTGPTAFGSGGSHPANTGSGDLVAIAGLPGGNLFLPQGYISGAALSDTMTFNNATFASLGVTPGTYIWSWGTGLPNQNFTLIIGGLGCPTQARQFLCSVALCSAWLPCGESWVAKTNFVRS